MHLSFSQGHSKEKGASIGIQWEFLNLLLKSVGVTLTEIQDVTFKFFDYVNEIKIIFIDWHFSIEKPFFTIETNFKRK